MAFTRNPATGDQGLFGEFLLNAQGEDVVAGIRTPRPLSEMERSLPGGLPAVPGETAGGWSASTGTCRT